MIGLELTRGGFLTFTMVLFLFLGFFLDAAVGEGATFFTTWNLNAITVDPYSKDLSGGGMGGDMDKEA